MLPQVAGWSLMNVGRKRSRRAELGKEVLISYPVRWFSLLSAKILALNGHLSVSNSTALGPPWIFKKRLGVRSIT